MLGIFATREGAEAVCEAWEDFVAPVPFDVPLPTSAEWPGVYYPLARGYAIGRGIASSSLSPSETGR